MVILQRIDLRYRLVNRSHHRSPRTSCFDEFKVPLITRTAESRW